jgi:two-component system, NarL family, sensor histidine kinase DesK
VTVAVTTYAATVWVPSWHRDEGILFGTLVATLAIWGISQSINRNIEMLAVREENARLALGDERNRFARDLHDILGHSLTVITVKAELANRMIDVDPDRARAELADLERLSRDALSDVRRAVEGYRELTLPGELARARMALSAAEIAADLPNTTDDVPTDRRELFAWAVREGTTNVIRHSGAQRCTVVLREHEVEVRDDGRGAEAAGTGNGLTGLRERAAALGGTVVTQSLKPGFSLRVVVP